MRLLATAFASLSLAILGLALAGGTAVAEDEIVTVTGQIVLVEEDSSGDEIITIVTETDKYVVHEESKASDIKAQAGKNVQAKGKVEVTEVSKMISVDEYVIVEDPPVGAQ